MLVPSFPFRSHFVTVDAVIITKQNPDCKPLISLFLRSFLEKKEPKKLSFFPLYFFSVHKKALLFWRDTLNGVSRQFYSPVVSDIATQ